MVQQKPSFQEKTRFLFMPCTLFLYEPILFVDEVPIGIENLGKIEVYLRCLYYITQSVL